jgi:hypothetical protein
MARRADPKRIDEAREAATRQRLIGTGATEATADAWLEAWAAQAKQAGMDRGGAYWTAAWEWIAAERQRRTRAL